MLLLALALGCAPHPALPSPAPPTARATSGFVVPLAPDASIAALRPETPAGDGFGDLPLRNPTRARVTAVVSDVPVGVLGPSQAATLYRVPAGIYAVTYLTETGLPLRAQVATTP